MTEEIISLRRDWRLGPVMGSGGFGHVYTATADDGSECVVKLVPKVPGADRELLFEQLTGTPHVLPVLDTGEWQDNYVLVMPRAEESLREHLESIGGKLPPVEVVEVLSHVAAGLAGLNNMVVHRDLKPENILLWNGKWHLSTSPETRQFALTPAYAAPEQWRAERATPATDIYAFGVIAFEMLRGQRPFLGPDISDYRDQHLAAAPPALSGPPSLLSLITECLLKPKEARPTAANILARLPKVLQQPSPASARLAGVNHSIVVAESARSAEQSANQSIEGKRSELFEAAKQSFELVQQALIDTILENAPSSNVRRSASTVSLEIGAGSLVIDLPRQALPSALSRNGSKPPFDVIAFAAITVKTQRNRFGYEGRSHSLWFCDAQTEGAYRWFETAFMVSPLLSQSYSVEPFALDPSTADAGAAFESGITSRQVAWKFTPLDQGDHDQFIERWVDWLAAAAEGKLMHPSTMPENSGGHRG